MSRSAADDEGRASGAARRDRPDARRPTDALPPATDARGSGADARGSGADARRPATHAEARALASSLRLRILRMTLDEPLTNQEIAHRLQRSPGSVLHHVRTLVTTGFLAPVTQRRGTRGAREVPYRATGKSWRMSLAPDDGAGRQALLAAFLAEVGTSGLRDAPLLSRLGLRLDDAGLGELTARLNEVLDEFAARPPVPGGVPWSVFLAVHPDPTRD